MRWFRSFGFGLVSALALGAGCSKGECADPLNPQPDLPLCEAAGGKATGGSNGIGGTDISIGNVGNGPMSGGGTPNMGAGGGTPSMGGQAGSGGTAPSDGGAQAQPEGGVGGAPLNEGGATDGGESMGGAAEGGAPGGAGEAGGGGAPVVSPP